VELQTKEHINCHLFATYIWNQIYLYHRSFSFKNSCKRGKVGQGGQTRERGVSHFVVYAYFCFFSRFIMCNKRWPPSLWQSPHPFLLPFTLHLKKPEFFSNRIYFCSVVYGPNPCCDAPDFAHNLGQKDFVYGKKTLKKISKKKIKHKLIRVVPKSLGNFFKKSDFSKNTS